VGPSQERRRKTPLLWRNVPAPMIGESPTRPWQIVLFIASVEVGGRRDSRGSRGRPRDPFCGLASLSGGGSGHSGRRTARRVASEREKLVRRSSVRKVVVRDGAYALYRCAKFFGRPWLRASTCAIFSITRRGGDRRGSFTRAATAAKGRSGRVLAALHDCRRRSSAQPSAVRGARGPR